MTSPCLTLTTGSRFADAMEESMQMHERWYGARKQGLGELRYPAVSPCGSWLAAVSTRLDRMEGRPDRGMLILVDLDHGRVEEISSVPEQVSDLCWSPEGQSLGFVRRSAARNEVVVLDVASRTEQVFCVVQHQMVEKLSWSPNGSRLLTIIADRNADEAGAMGGRFALDADAGNEPWAPTVRRTSDEPGRRRLAVLDIQTGCWVWHDTNVGSAWEGVWCGDGHIAVVWSLDPSESGWYRAVVKLVDLATNDWHDIFLPKHQLGCLAADPCGSIIAVVEAVCSDRLVVCGSLKLIDTRSGEVRSPDMGRFEISDIRFESSESLILAAHSAMNSALLRYRLGDREPQVLWESGVQTISGSFHASLPAGLSTHRIAFLKESWFEAPRLVCLSDGQPDTIADTSDQGLVADVSADGKARKVAWSAPDGLNIEGWLLLPTVGRAPYALVTEIHGGPVSQSRPGYLARNPAFRMLLRSGIAIFLPNPRGSTGRGQDFVRLVLGDMGGSDAEDILSGIDHLVAEGLACPDRLGVTGGSYGGFMTCQLIGQTNRFRAAAAICPVSNWVSERLTSNLAEFCDLFLGGDMTNAQEAYWDRSPVTTAHKVSTPTLLICGARDGSTPPGQGEEYFNALRLSGGDATLVTYPLEGHRPRSFPALADYSARIAEWFRAHLLQEGERE